MKNVIVLIISFLTISLFALNSSAQNLCTDPPGTKDSHYVKRYEGSCIIGYDFNNYDRVEIPLAYVSRDANREWKPEKSLVVEGAHTRILYAGPENRSSLEVFQNYEKALATAGYNNLYECEGDECSSGCKLGTFYLYPGKKQLRNKGNMTQYALKKVESQYFGVFKGTDQGKEIYISVYTVQNKDDYIVKELYNRSVPYRFEQEHGRLAG